MQKNTNISNIISLINQNQKILILPSSPLDGDSIGTALALFRVLKKLGKDPSVIVDNSVPELLKFLPDTKVLDSALDLSNEYLLEIDLHDTEIKDVRHELEGDNLKLYISSTKGKILKKDIKISKSEENYDLIFTVDTADLSQLGSIYEHNTELFHSIPVINIDHHISNDHFGKINYVDIMASSTAELLYNLIIELEEKEKKELIDDDVATLLLAGVITDTGSFQNSNTTPQSFKVASLLIARGARQQEIIQHVYKTKQLSQLKLWGRVLTKIQTDDKHKIVWSTISKQDLIDTSSTIDQASDIIDELLTNAPDKEIVALFKERNDGIISVSLRSINSNIDVSKIAEHFGGGGHPQAAGIKFEDADLLEVEYKVISYIRESSISTFE